MSAYANFVIDQGSLFEAIAYVTNEDDSAYDLTGLTPYCYVKKSYYSKTHTEVTSSVYGDPALGQIKLTLLPADSGTLKPGRYVYDIKVYNGDGTYVKKALAGLVTVLPQVTNVTLT
jgi:hypothetical protein